MSISEIKANILAKEVSIAQAKAAQSYYAEHYGYQIAQFEQDIYELNIKLQLAEADTTFYTVEQAAAEDEQDQDDPCYHCGRAIHSCVCANFEEESAADAPVARSEGTKLKWISSSNPETYRVAIVKKQGVLEVKNVTDGLALRHDYATCACRPCSEINLSAKLGAPMPPWLAGTPLGKTFFETEAAWCLSLPEGGKLTVTEKELSNRALKKLYTKPLVMLTDGGRLEELEKRFPGAKMVLTTNDDQFEICSMNDGERKQFRLYCEKNDEIRGKFSDFGVPKGTKPNLVAEWKGLFIKLSHLF